MHRQTLADYRRIKRKVDDFAESIVELEMALKAAGIQHLTGMPSAPSLPDKLGTAVVRLDEMRKMYLVKLAELTPLLAEIEEAISLLPEKEQEAARYRIIDGMSNERAAEKAEVSVATIKRRYKKAMKRLIPKSNRGKDTKSFVSELE